MLNNTKEKGNSSIDVYGREVRCSVLKPSLTNPCLQAEKQAVGGPVSPNWHFEPIPAPGARGRLRTVII